MTSVDLPAAASLLAPVMGWSPTMVEATFQLGHEVIAEMVAHGDELAGVVHVVRGMPGLPDHVFMLRLVVAEAARGRGLGTLLWQRVLDALPAGATVVARTPADDVRALAIAARWGFRPVNTMLYQRCELSVESLPTAAPVANASIEALRGRLVDGLADRVTAIMAAGSVLDIRVPTYLDPDGASQAFSAEPTLSIIAAQPGEVVAVFAVADGVDIGYSIAFVEDLGWHIADTAVIPAWRRRGVATWVKAELALLAARDGAHWLTTHNDADNVPILTLNDANGFRVLRRIVALRREP